MLVNVINSGKTDFMFWVRKLKRNNSLPAEAGAVDDHMHFLFAHLHFPLAEVSPGRAELLTLKPCGWEFSGFCRRWAGHRFSL